MAACIVCNQQTTTDDLLDAANMASLRTRLEQVLDEVVPKAATMCSSCQCDLSQIEMYYTLLTVFKKRYADTAKQRLESLEGGAIRNHLQETADGDPGNMQAIFGVRYSSGNGRADFTLQSYALKNGISAENYSPVVRLENIDVQTVKDEFEEIGLPSSSLGKATKKYGKTRKRQKPASVTKGEIPRKTESAPTLSEVIRLSDQDESERKQSAESFKDVESEDCSLGDRVIGDSDEEDPPYEPGLSIGVKMSPHRVVKEDVGEVGGTDLHGSGLKDAMGQASQMADIEQEDTARHRPITSDQKEKHTAIENMVTSRKKRGRPCKIQGRDQAADEDERVDKRKRRRLKKVHEGPQQMFACTLCEKPFVDKTRLKTHMKSHSEERPFICTICSNRYKDAGDLTAHMKIHSNDRPFKCEICGKGFLSRRLLQQRHMPTHSDERPFPCDKCDRKFKTPYQMRNHVKVHHTEGRQHLCSICGLALLTAGSLTSHMKLHKDEKDWPYKCSTCGKGYINKNNYLMHELTHQKKDTRETHLCSICGKGLLSAAYLKVHMKIHTGELDFKCTICNSSFPSRSQYQIHMTIHSGQKPHKCTECDKAFRLIYQLKAHMMTHTDERPFKCACGQAFRRNNKLQNHMRKKNHTEYDPNHAQDETLETGPLAPAETEAESEPVAVPQQTAPKPVTV